MSGEAGRGAPDGPFVGLRPFESDESLLFFGREEQTVALLQQLHHHGFVAVIGSSGSGKSSLVLAGLIPKLKGGFLAGERDRWHVAVMKPGQDPLGNLEAALASVVGEVSEPIAEAGTRGVLEAVSPLFAGGDANLLLLVDQFEELFRYGARSAAADETATERRARAERRETTADFVNILLDLADQRELPLYLVLTMRSDYLGDCDFFHGLPEAFNRSQYLVPRLTREQLRTAVIGPARLYGTNISESLVNRLLNDAGKEHDSLPVVQHALLRTWQEWQNDGRGTIDHGHYDAAGTVEHALENHAEEAFDSLSASQQRVAETMFRALSEIDTSNRRNRNPMALSVLETLTGAEQDEILDVVERFRSEERSFLMRSEELDDVVIDISHESLIRRWRRLRGWVDTEAEAASTYRRLADAARRKAENKGELLKGRDLGVALEWRAEAVPSEAWARRYGGDFGETMKYLRRSRWWSGLRTFLFLVLPLAAIGLYYWFAGAGKLIEEAHDELERRPLKSLNLALEARWHRFPFDSSVERRLEIALRDGLFAASRARPVWSRKLDRNSLVALSPTGTRLAARRRDGAVEVWSTATPEEPLILSPKSRPVETLAISLDGRRLVTGSLGSFEVWDATSGQPRFQGEAGESLALSPDGRRLAIVSPSDEPDGSFDHGFRVEITDLDQDLDGYLEDLDSVNGLALSPDGRRFAIVSEEGTIEVWSLEEDSVSSSLQLEPYALIREEVPVLAVAFGPTGKRIATGSADGKAKIWDLESRASIASLSHDAEVVRVMFGPAGKYLLSLTFTNVLTLWDLDTGEEIMALSDGAHFVGGIAFAGARPRWLTVENTGDGMLAQIWESAFEEISIYRLPGEAVDVAFSDDGSTLLAAGANGQLRLLDGRTAKLLRAFDDDHVQIRAAALSSRGSHLATGSDDGTLKIWNAETGRPVESDQGHRASIYSIAYSPDDGLLATAGLDKTARIWSTTGDQPLTLRHDLEHHAPVFEVTFSPDGKRVATASFDGSARVWDCDTGRLLRTLSDEHRILSVAFSIDGRRLATGTDGNLARIWNLTTGELQDSVRTQVGSIRSLAVSPDGRQLATGGDYGTVLWDAASGQRLFELPGYLKPVNKLAFSPDGRFLATASRDGTVRLEPLSLGDLVSLAKERIRRRATLETPATTDDQVRP